MSVKDMPDTDELQSSIKELQIFINTMFGEIYDLAHSFGPLVVIRKGMLLDVEEDGKINIGDAARSLSKLRSDIAVELLVFKSDWQVKYRELFA
jgi:hypothetical protein